MDNDGDAMIAIQRVSKKERRCLCARGSTYWLRQSHWALTGMPRHVSETGLGRGPRSNDCARTVARKAKLCRTLICGRRLSWKWPALWYVAKNAELDYLLPNLIANGNFLLICKSSAQQTTRQSSLFWDVSAGISLFYVDLCYSSPISKLFIS